MNFEEHALAFPCNDAWLYGVLSLPEKARSRGVLIVVGGPQYRVGSHRQFTLLARHLAAHGIPVLRFDSRGMGDSEGDTRTFEEVEDDLRCAIDTFFHEMPPLKELVIWGLCDAASAAVFYAYTDPRVTGLVLLNPWVRTNEGAAKVYLKHYYASRILEREFWGKVLTAKFNYSDAARSLAKTVSQALSGKKRIVANATDRDCDSSFNDGLPARMLHGLGHFEGKVLLITSGKDLTAQEFMSLVNSSPEWQKLLDSPRVSRLDFPEANHTFSRRAWRDTVANWTREWIHSW